MTFGPIVVGVDGSENGDRAVDWAARLAGAAGARVVAVHVFEPLAHLGDAPPIDLEAAREEARRRLAEEWCRPFEEAGAEVDSVLAEGHPAGVLSDVAADRGADLVVVGARGLGPIKAMLLGSTSRELTQAGRFPVAVIPPAAAQDGS